MSNEMTLYQPQTFNEITQVGTTLAASGYFKDATKAAQAVAKIMAGQELGIGAMASLNGIYFFDGHVTIGANIQAQLVKRSPKYDYRIVRLDDKGCEIAFFEIVDGKREELGRSSFGADDAKRAGLTGKANYQKYPQNMYFSRAISNGIKWYCPDVSMVGPLYTPEEMGVEVDENGDAIEGSYTYDTSETISTPATWVNDKQLLRAFEKFYGVNGLGMSMPEAIEALDADEIARTGHNIENDIAKYTGDREQAKAACRAWIEQRLDDEAKAAQDALAGEAEAQAIAEAEQQALIEADADAAASTNYDEGA